MGSLRTLIASALIMTGLSGAARANDDLRAFLRKGLCGGQTDAFAATRDTNDSSCKFKVHRFFYLFLIGGGCREA